MFSSCLATSRGDPAGSERPAHAGISSFASISIIWLEGLPHIAASRAARIFQPRRGLAPSEPRRRSDCTSGPARYLAAVGVAMDRRPSPQSDASPLTSRGSDSSPYGRGGHPATARSLQCPRLVIEALRTKRESWLSGRSAPDLFAS